MTNPCIPSPKSTSDYLNLAGALALCVAGGWLADLLTRSEIVGVMVMAAFAAAVLWPRQSPECKAYLAAQASGRPAWVDALAIPAPT